MAIHFILQSKGGVGKSYIACLLLQYLKDKNKNAIGIDLDPNTPALSKFKELRVERIDLVSDRSLKTENIDESKYLQLADIFEKNRNKIDVNYVIDCGASGYFNTVSFLQQEGVVDYLKGFHQKLYIHSVLKGGTDLQDTAASLGELLVKFPEVPFVVWLNEYERNNVVVTEDGKPFEEFSVYKDHKGQIASIVRIPYFHFLSLDNQIFFKQRKILSETEMNALPTMFQSMRLKEYKRLIWETFDQAFADLKQYEEISDSKEKHHAH